MTRCTSILSPPETRQPITKGLPIDLASLRQIIWEMREGMGATIAHSDKGDYPRWVDTSAMVADSLTNVMDAEVIESFMVNGVFGMTPTPKGLAINAKNGMYRKQTKPQATEGPSSQADLNA